MIKNHPSEFIIRFIFLLALVLFQDLNLHYGATYAAEIIQCDAGTYLHQSLDKSFCVECPVETFMPWTNHTAQECFECTKIEDSSVEVLISKCDRFHDADIQCLKGYFRRLARNPLEKPTCLKCTPACPHLLFEVHPCANFSDIGCCPGENYDYYTKHRVRMCRERPWMCRQGQYLDSHLNDCKPCPENTFMPEDYHSHTKCWDCTYNLEVDLPLHTVITKPCTSTQSPQYSCDDGFYIDHSLGRFFKQDYIGCSPCQACDEETYEVRPCNTSHNTLCCSKPTMIEVDGKCADVDVREFEQSQSTEVSGGTIAAVVVIPAIILIYIVILIICIWYHGCRRVKTGEPHAKYIMREERQTMAVRDKEVTVEIKTENQREGNLCGDGRIVSAPNIHTVTSSDRLLTQEE